MMKIGNLLLTLLVAAMIALMNEAHAAAPSSGQEMQRTASQMKHEAFGILKGVNTTEGKVKIAHEAIPSLGWPAMAMWFALRDPLPKDVMVGDSVRFELEQTQSKEWAITRIERKH